MHRSTAEVMRWILRAGGQVNVRTLAAWRWTWKRHGPREARRVLGLLEGRGWLKRLGTPRYPWWTVTRLGMLEAEAAGIEVRHKVGLEPKPSRVHDAETAAILEAAVRDGLFQRWLAPGEFSTTEKDAKVPDALALVGKQWVAIEAEYSKKGGTRVAGRSNWMSTALSVARRFKSPQSFILDDTEIHVRETVFLFPTERLAKGFETYVTLAHEHEQDIIERIRLVQGGPIEKSEKPAYRLISIGEIAGRIRLIKGPCGFDLGVLVRPFRLVADDDEVIEGM